MSANRGFNSILMLAFQNNSAVLLEKTTFKMNKTIDVFKERLSSETSSNQSRSHEATF